MEEPITKESLDEVINKRSNKGSKLSKLSYYAIPLIMTLVFVGVIVAGIVPRFFSIRKTNDEIRVQEQKYAEVKRKLDKLNQLNNDYSKLISDLEKIEKNFPSGQTSVSQFTLDIERQAEKYKLERTKVQSEENIEDKVADDPSKVAATAKSLSVNDKGVAVFFQIPANLEMQGNFKDYLDYYDSLKGSDKFLILSEVDLSVAADISKNKVADYAKLQGGLADSDKWVGKIIVNSYNFSKEAFRDTAEKMIITNTDFDYVLSNLK